jgi:hypothetical protein
MDEQPDLVEGAKAVLAMNDRGIYTSPSIELYPHQWLWDSCFTAIGLRNYDIDRAMTEIRSLFEGQWHNGMIPNMIFSPDPKYARDRNIWNSIINPNSPDGLATSGITQPPMLAEAIVQIGKKLKAAERRSWYKEVLPTLLAYHQWIYNERDPHNEGLALQIHPWETGLDNTPPWMQEMHEHQLSLWIRVVKSLKLTPLFTVFRRDTKHVPAGQRMHTIDALGLFSTQRRLRRKGYDINKVLKHSLFAIEDLTFNSVLVRANQHLQDIAKYIRQDIPEDMLLQMKNTETALEHLWDAYTGQYYSRDFVTHKLIKEASVATLLPLYAGTISHDRAKQLVRLLENQHVFATDYPIPSVPANSPWFNPVCYWQGPAWVNINWLIIDGLERSGFPDHATALKESTLDMISQNGFYEYFNPLTGEAAGVPNFSWTAALAIDLTKN